jgi:hypothetical protein
MRQTILFVEHSLCIVKPYQTVQSKGAPDVASIVLQLFLSRPFSPQSQRCHTEPTSQDYTVHLNPESQILSSFSTIAFRCFRSVLSRLTRLNSYREIVKKALNSCDLSQYIDVLSRIDFSTIFEISSTKIKSSEASAAAKKPATFDTAEIIDVEQAKAFTFQIAQTWALLNGIEVYTKSGALPPVPP